jgi:ribose/xylose/arabinose/galactoside ABC-type transport system permease subunit
MDQDQGQRGTDVDALLDELDSQAAGEVAVRPATRGFGRTVRGVFRMREIGVLGGAVLLFVALSLATPLFCQVDNVLLVARQISLLAIIATGVTFLFVSREIDLSVGSIYGFLGIVLAYMIAKWSVDPWLAMLITVALGAVLGLVNGLVTTRFGLPSFIVTLGTLSVLRGGALLISMAWPIDVKQVREGSFQAITAGHTAGIVPMQVFWMIGVMLIAGFVLARTRFGSHVYATGGNEEAAILAGIRTKQVKVICFMMTGALCGIAAALLLGQLRSAFPQTGTGYEMDIIAAVVIGGTPLFGGAGSILGTFLGAAVLGMISNGLVLLGVSAYVEPVVKGTIIVAAVLVDTLIRRRRV